MRALTGAVAFVLMCCSALAAPAKPPADVTGSFERANKLYEEAKYSEAAAAYLTLLDEGFRSAPVYFNLGNAFFKSGQIGRAVAAYLQANRSAPRDPDVEANLRFARERVAGPTWRPPAWQSWLTRATVNEWTLAAVSCLWICFLLLAARQWKPGLRWTRVPLALSLLGVLLFGTAGAMAHRADSQPRAVVTGGIVEARQGPLEESRANLTLNDGAEVLVLDQKDEWLQVTVGARKAGWVKREKITRL